MPTSSSVELKPPVQRFVFTEENTIGDLFVTVNELERAGKPPFLKFLGTRGAIVAVEVLVHDPAGETELEISTLDPEHLASCDDAYCNSCAPSREMAVTEGAES